MKLIKTLLLAITVIVALIMGVLFSTRNSQAFSLDLIFLQSPPISVAIWLLLALGLGMLLSAFIYSVAMLKLKRTNTQLVKRLAQADSAVNGLKNNT